MHEMTIVSEAGEEGTLILTRVLDFPYASLRDKDLGVVCDPKTLRGQVTL